MKISKGFIHGYFLILMLYIVFFLTSFLFKFNAPWMNYSLLGLIIVLFILIGRKSFVFTKNIIAYGIPFLLLAYVIYWNVIPAEDVYTLNVGMEGDTDSSQELYLIESPALGVRQMYDGTYFRELNGVAEVVFNPKAVLRNKNVTITVNDGVSIIPENLNFNPDDYKWDYTWDFTKGVVPEELEIEQKGNKTKNASIYLSEKGFEFDGKTKVVFPNSSDMFEEGPFSVYVEWTPKKSNESFQQIVGHYNWRVWQNNNSIIFSVGRMMNRIGPSHTISQKIDKDFFNKKHSLLGIYNPSKNGYIEMYLDDNYIGIKYFKNQTIWKGYGGKRDLSLGLSEHGSAKSFRGTILKSYFSKNIFVNNIISVNVLVNQINNPIKLIGGKLVKIDAWFN